MNKLVIWFLSILVFRLSGFAADLSCQFFYEGKTLQTLIEQASLTDLARIDGQWFEVAVPHVSGNKVYFEYKKVQDWEAVKEFFEGVSDFEKQLAKVKLDEYIKGFRRITRYFSTIAQAHNAKMKARIKKIKSLRNKIIDRARSYSVEGKTFTFDSLDDFIGVRLMLRPESDLMSHIKFGPDSKDYEVQAYFARQLGFEDPYAVTKIEFKGNKSDRAKGKYYRAAHVTVRMPDGIPVEVQLMSKTTAVWHQWDHPKVYKANGLAEFDKSRIKSYSQFWIRLLNVMEDSRTGVESLESYQDIFRQFNITAPLIALIRLKIWPVGC